MTAATAPPSRRPSLFRRLVGGVLAVVLIAVTVLLGRAIALTAPIGEDHRRPFIKQGQMNEPVVEHDIEVTVLSVRGGRSYTSFGGVRSTQGLFLLVRTQVEALEVPAAVRYAELLDEAGRAYSAISHSDSLYEKDLLPRIPMEGELLFEVPTAVASQLRLRISSHRGYWGEYQIMVEMPLRIDEDQIKDWHNDSAPLTLSDPEVVG